MKEKFKTGILIVNLGTPNSPTTSDVRKYLREFLMDGRVIDIPYLFRWLLVNLIIAPFRSSKSAKVYKKLWTERGSPLKFYGEDNQRELQKRLGVAYEVRLAMRYQNPSIDSVLEDFKKAGYKKIVIIPLFPQYASATTGSIYEKVMKIISTWQVIPAISFVNNFYDHPKIIEHFTKVANVYRKDIDFDHYLFSYHGVPERQIRKGDCSGICTFSTCCATIHSQNQGCYKAQCHETSRLLAEALGITSDKYTTSFQSRLGKDPWIKPYTDKIIEELVSKGNKKILAFSPAFVADCLETTIEVGEEYKELFEEKGGEHWQLVESLNNSSSWIDLLEDIVKKETVSK